MTQTGNRWILLLVACLLMPPAGAGAQWAAQGGSLNQSTYADAAGVVMPSSPVNTPYAGVAESGQFHVRAWDGSQWQTLGGALNVSQPLSSPDMALGVSAGGVPHAAWMESTTATASPYLYVKRYTGSNWELLGGPLNAHPLQPYQYTNNPRLAFNNEIPYVSWTENRITYVKRYLNGAWESVGQGFAGASIHHYANILVWNHVLCLALSQDNTPPVLHIYRWDGAAWTPMGDYLNVSLQQGGIWASMTEAAGQLYVAWIEGGGNGGIFQTYVKRWNGSAWEPVGGSLNVDPAQYAQQPTLSTWRDQPLLSWREAGQVEVRFHTGTVWERLASGLHIDPSQPVSAAMVANVFGNPYVITAESDGVHAQARVQRYQLPLWEERFLYSDDNPPAAPGSQPTGWYDASNDTTLDAQIAYAATDSLAQVQVAGGAQWGKVLSFSQSVNLAESTKLKVRVSGVSGSFKLGVFKTSPAWEAHYQAASQSEPGEYELDIPALTGWSGTQILGVALVAEGAGAVVTVDSVCIDAATPAFQPTPAVTATPTATATLTPTPTPTQTPDPNDIWYDHFVGASGSDDPNWTDESSQPGLNANLAYTDTLSWARVSRTGADVWGKVLALAQTVDASVYPLVQVSLANVNASTWKIGIQEQEGSYRYWDLNTSSTAAGTFTYDYRAVTGWSSGSHRFSVVLVIEGPAGSSVDFDAVRITRAGAPFTPTITLTPTLTLTPTPTAVDHWRLIGQGLSGTGSYINAMDMSVYQNQPHCVWLEMTNYPSIVAMHYNGTGWVRDSSSLGTWAFNPHAGGDNSSLYASFGISPPHQGNRNYVDRYTVSGWQASGYFESGSIEAVTARNGTGYLLRYLSPYLYVFRNSGSGWAQVHEALTTAGTGSLAVTSDGTPYAAYTESGGAKVKVWNGQIWQLMEPLNSPECGGYGPQLAGGSRLYAAWVDTAAGQSYLRVKAYNGTAWESLGEALNYDPTAGCSPRIAVMADEVPYVLWIEAGRVYVKHWNGTTWERNGNALNLDPNQQAQYGALAVSDTQVFAAWLENVNGQRRTNVKVLDLEGAPSTATPTAPPPVTATPTPTATATPTPPSVFWREAFAYSDDTPPSTPGAQCPNWYDETNDPALNAEIVYASADGLAVLNTAGAEWGKVLSSSQDVDVSFYRTLEVTIPSISNGGVRVAVFSQANGWEEHECSGTMTSPGTYYFDLPDSTGWSGVKNMGVALIAEGAACAVVLDSIRIHALGQPSPTPTPDATYTPLWQDVFDYGDDDLPSAPGDQPPGWYDETDDGAFNAEFRYSSASGLAELVKVEGAGWGKTLSFRQDVDLSAYPILEVTFSSIAGGSVGVGVFRVAPSWNEKVFDYPMQPGVYRYDMRTTGWSGTVNMGVFLWVPLDTNSVVIDSVKILPAAAVSGSSAHNFCPFAQTVTPVPTGTLSATPTVTSTTTPVPTASRTATPTQSVRVEEGQVRAYPNPARGRVNFAYTLNGSGKGVIDIYKFSGERVAHIVEHRDGGPGQTLTTAWEAAGVAPGIYLCRIVITDGSGKEILNIKKKAALVR